MGFYFIVHTLLGLLAASANILVQQGRADTCSVPLWVHRHGPLFAAGGFFACIAAIITTLANYGVVWAGITVAELFLGAVIAWTLSMSARAFLVLTSPVSVVFILGALWKFWFV
jgi:hypothetical protein